ncbi:hypothetical protein [Pseudodesulfovibrio piezophilus]|uniref:4Fe-4S ferredoxin iron-sulfur binding domain-containing protein n=1 Tax=Pseudodesulfovibrio piezophilus (strain DSM 21447 / JCM 15486 / C1TLV30) TaxID=1322246 RepID=M1WNC3_PSEP2|nr:hypothetical protein [Pseudodesulfovibrio piezophilus]CCH50280.1 4Fe-4S ferredoxin iron-sulfur binding domain-containing protein [Pseudodesulfovibrio piezophilus C1TLV30]
MQRIISPWISRLFVLFMAGLAATGLMQMPLAKRYYVTTLPGLGWTGDFYFVHKLHYIFAALLLFLLGVVVVTWFLYWRNRVTLTGLGGVRCVLVGGLILSGGFRVYRNIPDVTFDPTVVLLIEWVHLGLFIVMGLVACLALVQGRSRYMRGR